MRPLRGGTTAAQRCVASRHRAQGTAQHSTAQHSTACSHSTSTGSLTLLKTTAPSRHALQHRLTSVTLYVTRQCTRLMAKWTKSSFFCLTTPPFWEDFLAEDAPAAPAPERGPPPLGSSPWDADLLCRRRKTDPLACIRKESMLCQSCLHLERMGGRCNKGRDIQQGRQV